MQYKTNRNNHDFQIAYFLAGSCHTPDAAYSLLCDLRADRSDALKVYAASKLREEAKISKARLSKFSIFKHVRLTAKADIVEIQAMHETVQRNLEGAIAELAMIDKCLAKLEPLRKYAHLPLIEAHEAAQEEEWKLELIERAENSLLTTGSLPTDQFATMRMHPAFQSEILPVIHNVQRLMQSGDTSSVTARIKKFDIPLMLSISKENK